MNTLQKLAELANKLDSLGQTEAADQIDTILKEAIDWKREVGKMWGGIVNLLERKRCSCSCQFCSEANKKTNKEIDAFRHLHDKCITGKCEIKYKDSDTDSNAVAGVRG